MNKLQSFKKETPTKASSISDKPALKSSNSSTISDNNSQSSVSSISSFKGGDSKTPVSHTKGDNAPTLLWVDKYKPTSMKQIIGQTGDKSNAKKLLDWLNNWHKNQAAGVKPVTSGKFFGKGGSDNGAGFKAALLSGPPGIGKTTTATVVCKVGCLNFNKIFMLT